MLRHVVLIRLTEAASESDVSAIVENLRTLPAIVPEIRSYSVGTDAGVSEGNFDLVVVGEFDDEAGYRAYATNEDHVQVIETFIKPFVAERSAVQYTLAE